MEADAERRLDELGRLIARVASGDLSEKPEIDESDDAIGRLSVAVRFLIDDLQAARDETRQRIEELESLNGQLKELAAARARFINTAAHELNTPLTPIRLQMYTLRSGRLGELNERQRAAVDLFDRNIDRIATLVRDFLDAARLQSDRLAITPRTLDLAELVGVAVEVVQAQAEDAGVSIVASPRKAAPVEADADRLTQVLLNLLTNALKFTPRGGRIEVQLRDDPHEATILVHDTGAGLTAQQQARLFQPFSQVHDTMQRTRNGTGLGLYISRGIVEQHGGHMWVESAGEGKGSTFAFTVPRVAPERPAPPPVGFERAARSTSVR